jgi:hypothetical protein
VTDDELHEFAWRECSKGMSDPFCWTGYAHLVMQVCVRHFERGYRAAERHRAAYTPLPIPTRAELEKKFGRLDN